MSASTQAVHDALRAWAKTSALPERWGVALSGGADSTALLRAAHDLWPGRVHAIHVNHGLQAAAVDFENHSQNLCNELGVPLTVVAVDAFAESGQSPEDAARQARYRALAKSAQELELAQIWLAQHQDDQLETVLLALSRGAGVAGLAAMSSSFDRHGVSFARPLLGVTGEAIRAWLHDQGFAYCEDPSNADTQYTRNRIRHQVTPALRAAFPGIAAMVSRSAAHMGQAQSLLTELAQMDLDSVGQPPSIAKLQQLSPQRQGNAIRHWLKQTHGIAPSTAQLEALLRQIAACTTRGHRIELKVGPGFVKRDQGNLLYLADL